MPGSPSKFLMAAFVRVFAQRVTAEICPMQPFVSCYFSRNSKIRFFASSSESPSQISTLLSSDE